MMLQVRVIQGFWNQIPSGLSGVLVQVLELFLEVFDFLVRGINVLKGGDADENHEGNSRQKIYDFHYNFIPEWPGGHSM